MIFKNKKKICFVCYGLKSRYKRFGSTTVERGDKGCRRVERERREDKSWEEVEELKRGARKERWRGRTNRVFELHVELRKGKETVFVWDVLNKKHLG